MIWFVWDSYGQTEADARRIDAPDCISAAEEWSRRDGAADPMSILRHLDHGLDLRARAEGTGTTYRVFVEAEASIHYSGKEGWT